RAGRRRPRASRAPARAPAASSVSFRRFPRSAPLRLGYPCVAPLSRRGGRSRGSVSRVVLLLERSADVKRQELPEARVSDRRAVAALNDVEVGRLVSFDQ